ncbi:MAG: hypothetical protein B7Z37_25220 [Verrucomicrobia bacterium 12-59-8]|nr:MAG: hypothetical protein B7Z37_25220 [Verrucomicrobia bacterium 12-59-8]
MGKSGSPLVKHTMPTTEYSTFFSAACGSNRQPYAYQQRLADEECISCRTSVSTDLGKNHNPFKS